MRPHTPLMRLEPASVLTFTGALRHPVFYRAARHRALLLPSLRPSSFIGRLPQRLPVLRWQNGSRRQITSSSPSPPFTSSTYEGPQPIPAAPTDLGSLSSLAGTPEVVPALRELFATRAADGKLFPSYKAEAVAASFPYLLDSFQMDAMRALCDSRNVILSAPTGSGCVFTPVSGRDCGLVAVQSRR